jgi:hypothetical protein
MLKKEVNPHIGLKNENISKHWAHERNKSKTLVANGLWNPELIAAISYIIGGANITFNTSVDATASEPGEYHCLAWASSCGKEVNVSLEITNRDASEPPRVPANRLMLGCTEYRTERERLALEGVAARHGLELIQEKARPPEDQTFEAKRRSRLWEREKE